MRYHNIIIISTRADISHGLPLGNYTWVDGYLQLPPYALVTIRYGLK